jgi:hypothetical protein
MGEPTDVLGLPSAHPCARLKGGEHGRDSVRGEHFPVPQRVRAAATDFSERRPQIWSGIDPKYFTVHALGDRTAEVTEGGREFGGIWAREHYDWSDPDRVVARVLDSNIFRPGSRWALRVRPTPTGGSRVEWTSLRQPNSLKGRLVVLALRVASRQHLRGYLQQTLAELKNQPA